MSFHYKYKAGQLLASAKELGYFEQDSAETPLGYGIAARGRTHLDVTRFIGCGAWFSDQFAKLPDDYDAFVNKLRERARAKWPDRFATPAEIAAFLNETVPAEILGEPMKDVRVLSYDLEYCWGRHKERVRAQLDKMETDLATLNERFQQRKRRWEEALEAGDFYIRPDQPPEKEEKKKKKKARKE